MPFRARKGKHGISGVIVPLRLTGGRDEHHAARRPRGRGEGTEFGHVTNVMLAVSYEYVFVASEKQGSTVLLLAAEKYTASAQNS